MRIRPWHVAIIWALALTPLARWGLPSGDATPTLFGGGDVWPAERFRAAAAQKALTEREAGADTDLNPLGERERIIDLTRTDDDRAEILRRYRLYSHQPDEMITFRALQQMKPRALDFDPRLYQYGGAYIYLVAASLVAASLLGVTTITSDVGVYLARPELFAAFYVVSRLISLAFAASALCAVARLGRLSGVRGASWIAMLTLAMCPVFISGALEAKPHVPSATMLLWATVAALRYRERASLRRALQLGLYAGAAAGLVLTGFAAALLWPATWLAMRRHERGPTARHLLIAAALASFVYAATNPYVIYNTLFRPAALKGNLSNSTAMYEVSRLGEGALRVGQLYVEGAAWPVIVVGLLGVAWLVWNCRRETLIASSAALGMTLLCVAIGAGKPAEFGRFLVMPAALLCVAAGVATATLARRSRFAAAVVAALLVISPSGLRYLRAFADDGALHIPGAPPATRAQAAAAIGELIALDQPIGVFQEPAPYCIPPMDFTRRTVRLLPKTHPVAADLELLPEWVVLACDNDADLDRYGPWWREHYRVERSFGEVRPGYATQITWANKPVFLLKLKATRVQGSGFRLQD